MLENLNKFLHEKDIFMIAIRGNHDNPEYFKGDYKFTNLHLVPDYTVLKLEGQNFLFIGWSISIDRKPRIQ
jgi:calcineurin-like phosphoesterase family protein